MISPSYYGLRDESMRAKLLRARDRALNGKPVTFSHGVGLDAMVTFEVPAELALPCLEHALAEIK